MTVEREIVLMLIQRMRFARAAANAALKYKLPRTTVAQLFASYDEISRACETARRMVHAREREASK